MCCADATACRCSKHGGDFGRKTNDTKGLADTKRVHRGPKERNGEIVGSPPGSKVIYVFSLSLPLRLATASFAAKHTCPGPTIELFARGAELILLYHVSRNETTTSLISTCRNVQFACTFNLYDAMI